MADDNVQLNPAEQASERTLGAVYDCLDGGECFLVEAGAGAGKTYTLIKALQYCLDRNQRHLQRRHQKIACITFTNVAKEEIESRTDHSPLIFCDTVHAFCWSLIRGFQPQLREALDSIEKWQEMLDGVDDVGNRSIVYDLGHRALHDDRIFLHHDDVIALAVKLLGQDKFRSVVAGRYPVILIDEYQDTNKEFVDAIQNHFLLNQSPILFGFFGDHWQKIYGDGCGRIEQERLAVIDKQANFRSVTAIVNCLNRMRPELPQFVVDPDAPGSVRVFHTNEWTGRRQTGTHWKGDLPDEEANRAFESTLDALEADGWDMQSGQTKMLMLTHRILATRQGYGSIPSVFRYNDSFTKKEHLHVAYFADVLEPACIAYREKRYGEMFALLDQHGLDVHGRVAKREWIASMDTLLELRDAGTVREVVQHLQSTQRPRLPNPVEKLERTLTDYEPVEGEEKPRVLVELEKLHAVPYTEVVALSRYLTGHSPFETKHGVKGAQFANVLVVIGRGWNQYNFNEMLELAADPTKVPSSKLSHYERNRNLFYVVCSRPQNNLAILFTQKLSNQALAVLGDWFGEGAIVPVAM